LIDERAAATLESKGKAPRKAKITMHPNGNLPIEPEPTAPVAWAATRELVAYEAASTAMAERVNAIAAGAAPELVWLLQHPPLYTAGTSARNDDLLAPSRFPVHRTGRGGQFTYHGPGQRVAYVMLDVKRRFGDVRAYVTTLEDWIVDALAALGVTGERSPGRVGVWVRRPGRGVAGLDKIAAIGVRLSRWVSSHGISLNVAPDLSHYQGIVPCGIWDGGITSLANLGVAANLDAVDAALRAAFERRFAKTVDQPDHGGVFSEPNAMLTAGAKSKSAPLPGYPDSRAQG
jgi:lipoyl(octanoyl) transferase